MPKKKNTIATVKNAKILIENPKQLKAKEKEANARLNKLAEKKMLSKSVAGKRAQKFLKRHKQSRFNYDASRLITRGKNKEKEYSYALELLLFLEHPSSDANKLESFRAGARQSFIDNIINYADASDEDKQVLREYLQGLSEAQWNKFMSFYGPVMNSKFSLGSGDRFQAISNHMIEQGQRGEQDQANNIFTQISPKQDVEALNTAKNQTKSFLEHPEKYIDAKIRQKIAGKVSDKVADAAYDRWLENPPSEERWIEWNMQTKKDGWYEPEEVQNIRRAVYDAINKNPLEGMKTAIVGNITNDIAKQNLYMQGANAIFSGNALPLFANIVLSTAKKNGLFDPEKLDEEASKITNNKDFKISGGKIATDVIKDLILSGGNLAAAGGMIVKDVFKTLATDFAVYAAKDIKNKAKQDVSLQKATLKQTHKQEMIQYQNKVNALLGDKLIIDPITGKNLDRNQSDAVGQYLGVTPTPYVQFDKTKSDKTISVSGLKKGLRF